MVGLLLLGQSLTVSNLSVGRAPSQIIGSYRSADCLERTNAAGYRSTWPPQRLAPAALRFSLQPYSGIAINTISPPHTHPLEVFV